MVGDYTCVLRRKVSDTGSGVSGSHASWVDPKDPGQIAPGHGAFR